MPEQTIPRDVARTMRCCARLLALDLLCLGVALGAPASADASFGVLGSVATSGVDAEVHQFSLGPRGFDLLATNQLTHVDQQGTVTWQVGRTSDHTSAAVGAEGVATAPSGLVAVTLPDAGVVRWFDQRGTPVADWPVPGAAGIRIALDTVFVDGATGLQAFSLDGRPLYRAPYDFSASPRVARYEFAFDGHGGAWLASLGATLGDSYLRVGATGMVAARVTGLGRIDGLPHGVGGFTSDARGFLWAADSATAKIYEFDLSGRVVRRCGAATATATNPLSDVADVEQSVDGSLYAVANAPVRLVHLGRGRRLRLACGRPVLGGLRVTRLARKRGRLAGTASVNVSEPAAVRFSLERRGHRVASLGVTTAKPGRVGVNLARFGAVSRRVKRYVLVIRARDASGNDASPVRRAVGAR
jgi:hypothetical protein